MLAEERDGGGEVLGPDADMTESDGSIAGRWGDFKERVFSDLQITECGFARGVLDGERFFEADGLGIEAHGLIVILGVNSDVVQAQAGGLTLLRSFFLSRAGLHQEASNNDSCREQTNVSDEVSHGDPPLTCCFGQCRAFLSALKAGPTLGSFCRWAFRTFNCMKARSKARFRLPS